MTVILKKRSAWNFAILSDNHQGTFARIKPPLRKGTPTILLELNLTVR